ncbi:hypothetical protein AAJP84_04300 [Bartonella schoenbuchensis]|uniref:hypothetical protein n=1 Tax=Bartonella schoenbuchensis TaxID=165694 RepID=UPI0031CC8D22
MVMRRVFNHHVCFCVLSTAILAGLALMTSQNKVYAAQNCKGVAGGEDNGKEPIVCDGGKNGTGWGNEGGWGELSGKRDIDMSEHSGQAAVTVYNGSGTAKITISSKLTVTDSRSSSQMPAIKVHSGGILVVVDADVAEVQKGIVVEGPGSSVMVVKGTIGVRAKGGPVIEVSNNGKVVLNEWVTVGTVSGNNAGEVVINNGGTVQLNGQSFNNVTTGIKIKGTKGTANVRGGATINLASSGTGLEVEGQANADVMDMTITGKGSGTGVLINGRGTVTVTKVTMKDVAMGARVTGGNATVMMMSGEIRGRGGKGVVMSGVYAYGGRIHYLYRRAWLMYYFNDYKNATEYSTLRCILCLFYT